jgi:hypothetical protein
MIAMTIEAIRQTIRIAIEMVQVRGIAGRC